MSCKCKECIFSHDHPFLITKEPIKNPRHCALHYCTVEAEEVGCRDGKARTSDDKA